MVKIPSLPSDTSMDNDDLLVFEDVSAGTTERITKANLFDSLITEGVGWLPTVSTVSTSTGYNAGNRTFTLDTSSDLTSVLSAGMPFRVERNTVPPTQCADFEASSSQYASVASSTGITFTDDFTCEAWVKLESYSGSALHSVITRTASGNGWAFDVLTTGEVRLVGDNAGADYIQSNQKIPVNKWVHIAASINISSATGAVYIDGVEVPSAYTNGTSTATTNTGTLWVGARESDSFFDGKLADVRVWSDIRSEAEIQDNMFGYPSDTTNLVAHFKLAGDFTDSSANGNDLTASGGAVATNVDNPWNATEYGTITAVTATDMTVKSPVGYGIPNETLNSPSYSTNKAPFGLPELAQTVPDKTITAEKLSTPVAFRASSSQSVVATTQVEVTSFDDEHFDLGSNFNHTDGRFTAPYNGAYQINAMAQALDLSLNKRCIVFVYVNGGAISSAQVPSGAANQDPTPMIAVTLLLNAGDYVTMQIYQENTNSRTVRSYFSGHLIGRTD